MGVLVLAGSFPSTSCCVLGIVWSECWWHWCFQPSMCEHVQWAGVQGGSTARQIAQAGQWKCSTPQTSCSVYEWRLAGGKNLSFSFLWVRILSWPGDQTFLGVRTFSGVLQNLQFSRFYNDCSVTDCGHQVYISAMLYIVCFAYSLSSVVLSSTLFSYWTVFISTHEFYLLSISPPHSARGEGGGWENGCWVPVAIFWVKPCQWATSDEVICVATLEKISFDSQQLTIWPSASALLKNAGTL